MKRLKKAKGSAKGAGRLFKRYGGKDYPADAPIKGNFYLTIKKDGGKTTIALKNEEGQAITDRKEAEQERDRLTAPTKAKDDLRRVKAIASVIQDAEQRLEQAVSASEPRLALSEAWEAYQQQLKYIGRKISEGSARTFQAYLDEFECWMVQQYPAVTVLADVTTEHAKAFAEFLCDKGETAKTFNCKTGFLRTFFNRMEEPGRIEKNPFAKIETHPKETQTKRALTVDELQRLIESAEGEYKTLFIVGTFTGLRLYDCATLKWGEVDLDRKLIVRLPHKTQRSGKAVRVGIPAFLHEHLSAIAPDQRDGYIMPEIADCYLNDRKMRVSRRIRAIFKAAGIERTRHAEGRARAAHEEGFHALRHTFVSLMAEKGAPMATVQALVGHSNPAMTAYYHKTTDQAALNAANLFELTDGGGVPKRERLPTWALELISNMNGRNWKAVKNELMEAGK